jgi:hypothetical protein
MAEHEFQASSTDEKLPPPIGTLFVMTVYLAILAGMWFVMLYTLIHR